MKPEVFNKIDPHRVRPPPNDTRRCKVRHKIIPLIDSLILPKRQILEVGPGKSRML